MDALYRLLQFLVTSVTEHPYITTAAVAACIAYLRHRKSSEGQSKKPSADPVDTVVVHGIGKAMKTPSLSPYTLKLEVFLKLAKIPYIVADGIIPSSKGKFPWISYNGEVVPDSQFIIEFFKKKLGADLNKHLSQEEKAIAHAFRVMLDEFHYWAYLKFVDIYNPSMVDELPIWPIRRYLKYEFDKYLYAQGMGRHTEEEVLGIYKQNLQILEDYLGDRPFFMGDEPTEVDCSIFGHVGMFIWYPSKQLGWTIIQDNYPKLHQLCLRLKERAFPDWDQCLLKKK